MKNKKNNKLPRVTAIMFIKYPTKKPKKKSERVYLRLVMKKGRLLCHIKHTLLHCKQTLLVPLDIHQFSLFFNIIFFPFVQNLIKEQSVSPIVLFFVWFFLSVFFVRHNHAHRAYVFIL